MLTAEQLVARRASLGASEVSTILGIGQKRADGTSWKTPADIWCLKKGMNGKPAGTAADVGSYLEPGIINVMNHLLGLRIQE